MRTQSAELLLLSNYGEIERAWRKLFGEEIKDNWKEKEVYKRKGIAQTDLTSREKPSQDLDAEQRISNGYALSLLRCSRPVFKEGPIKMPLGSSMTFAGCVWYYVSYLVPHNALPFLSAGKVVWDVCFPSGLSKGNVSTTLTSNSHLLWSLSSSPKKSLTVFCWAPGRPQDSWFYGSYHF